AWPPPNEPTAFESLCLDLWEEIWGPESGAQKNGRSGQPQAGVDVFGKRGDRWIGVQCKQKDGLLRSKLTTAELDEEIRKVLGKEVKGKTSPPFEPALSEFLFATTGPRDAEIQKTARRLAEEHGAGFSVAVWAWQDIWHEIYGRPQFLARIGPIYWPQLFAIWNSQKKISTSRLTHTAAKLFGREAEIAKLDAAWADPKTHVVTLVAWGGVGKTSLVAEWAGRLAARDYDGASYFDWSFYSQGTKEQGAATGEPFVNEALRFFGGEEGEPIAVSATSAWDKGSKLAEFVAKRRALLILDGLEPLQHPASSPLAGQLKDPGLEALLKGLAQRNSGLCVVTTRESVTNLASFHGTTAPEWELERLDKTAGVALLKSLGVASSAKELEALVEEAAGHALTIQLLGTYLARAHGGDVRKRDLVNLEKADAKTQGGHAFKAIAAYENWLGGEKEEGGRQLAILRLLGLFDRPADRECLAALRKEPAISGLTDPLVGLPADDWEFSVSALDACKLLSKRDDGALDAHPLVREYFAKQVHEKHEEAWRAAHGRLFEHLRNTADHRPDTLEGLQPLYQAVAHGCLAGRYEEAYAGIFRDHILRGTGADGLHNTSELGAFGADLGAVSCFFGPPWQRVVPALSEADQAWLLSVAAFDLRALGRLTEAVESIRAGLPIEVKRKDWTNAAISASDLSELELTLGEVSGAVADAVRSVTFAERRGDAFLEMAFRTTHADALHQTGRREEARVLFREAECLQAKRQPGYPRLYSLWGFRYSDLLLGEAERAAGRAERPSSGALAGFQLGEVQERARQTLGWVTTQNWLLDIALDHLTLGRVALYRSILEGTVAVAARSEIEQAVAGLLRAGRSDYLPKVLLTRAWLRFAEGYEAGARADLAEAEEIASRGPMPLYLADIALYRGRMFKDRAALAEARRLIEKHGYGRRLGELEDAEAMVVLTPSQAVGLG
ncbi:MAG TPA: hypothetical protein VN851_11105, partial [Thermoanaerobaculia bacterium]|nr:hypothetical protein [Thermoanaerobaculia bacterium]